MARQRTYDRLGNEIYLTDERWTHIIETHEAFTHVIVVVTFSRRTDQQGTERTNNFVLTAYQVSRS